MSYPDNADSLSIDSRSNPDDSDSFQPTTPPTPDVHSADPVVNTGIDNESSSQSLDPVRDVTASVQCIQAAATAINSRLDPAANILFVLKPMVTLPSMTYQPDWSIDPVWINFYFERYFDPNEVYLRDTAHNSRKCGCEKVSCPDDMRRSTYTCGFCGKKMSNWCMQDGPYGSCRACFISIYCTSTTRILPTDSASSPSPSSDERPPKRQLADTSTPDPSALTKRSRVGPSPESPENAPALESPNGKALRQTKSTREQAAKNMRAAARKFNIHRADSDPPLVVGNVVTIAIHAVDKGPTDAARLPGVVVEVFKINIFIIRLITFLCLYYTNKNVFITLIKTFLLVFVITFLLYS